MTNIGKTSKASLVLAMAFIVQAGGFIWWTAQQAQTISQLDQTVSEMSSKMAIEDSVNMKRDVLDNSNGIKSILNTLDELKSGSNNNDAKLDELVRQIQKLSEEGRDLDRRILDVEDELWYE